MGGGVMVMIVVGNGMIIYIEFGFGGFEPLIRVVPFLDLIEFPRKGDKGFAVYHSRK